MIWCIIVLVVGVILYAIVKPSKIDRLQEDEDFYEWCKNQEEKKK